MSDEEHHQLNRWERKAEDRERQTDEVMNLWRQMEEHLGGLLTIAKAPPTADVLFSGAVTIPAPGWWSRSWPVPYQAIELSNFSAATLTIAQTSGNAAPSQGGGVARVPTGYFRVVTMRGQDLVVWGASGDTFDLTVYARPRQPAAGPCGTIT